MEFDKLVAFAKENEIDMTVVAPDDPLAGGAVDAFLVCRPCVFKKPAAESKGRSSSK